MARLAVQHDPAVRDKVAMHPSPACALPTLLATHNADYVRRFCDGQLDAGDMRAIGFPWTPSVVTRNLASVGGTVAATEALLRQPELRMTAHISGGTHHAFAARGEGFCVWNDLAVAAQLAMDRFGLSRVTILDLDVHQVRS